MTTSHASALNQNLSSHNCKVSNSTLFCANATRSAVWGSYICSPARRADRWSTCSLAGRTIVPARAPKHVDTSSNKSWTDEKAHIVSKQQCQTSAGNLNPHNQHSSFWRLGSITPTRTNELTLNQPYLTDPDCLSGYNIPIACQHTWQETLCKLSACMSSAYIFAPNEIISFEVWPTAQE